MTLNAEPYKNRQGSPKMVWCSEETSRCGAILDILAPSPTLSPTSLYYSVVLFMYSDANRQVDEVLMGLSAGSCCFRFY